MRQVRILVADDHSIVRRGVRALLETRPGWKVCGEAATGAEAVKQAKKLRPDVVVIDITMPDLNGFEATRQIRAAAPQTEVLVLTVHESEQALREVLDAGALGYVSKSDLDLNLSTAIESLLRHKPFLSSRVSEMMLERYLKRDVPVPPIPPMPAGTGLATLTPRQREIVRLLAEGKTNKEVALILGISVKTAETHRNNIMRKLQLRSFSHLVRYAIRHNLVEV
jgi:DNA-binding NarL/FixJ family response regulator